MSSQASSLFVGRASELDTLRTTLAATVEGSQSAFIGGDAGMGKTRLLRAFLEEVDATNAHVFEGSATPLGRDAPYGPFADALRQLVRRLGVDAVRATAGAGAVELAQVLPTLRTEPADLDANTGLTQTRLFEAFLELLARLADQAPLIVALEDLHWADESSRSLLAFLIRSLRHEPVFFIATYRMDAASPGTDLHRFLAELSRHANVVRIDLPPLSADELRAHMEAMTGKPVSNDRAALIGRLSAGNPLFAGELAKVDEGAGGLPASIRELLLDRLASMDGRVREALRVGSLTGGAFDDAMVSAVLEMPERSAADVLRDAVAARLITPVGEGWQSGYVFRIPLLRDVLVEELAPMERSHLHGRLAQILAGRPLRSRETEIARAFEVATHWLNAGDVEHALPAVMTAAAVAERSFAWPEAHRLLERALALQEIVPQAPERMPIGFRRREEMTVQPAVRQAELLRRTAESASLAGQPQRAVELARYALEHDAVGPATDPLVFERLGRYLWEAGESAAANTVFEDGARSSSVDHHRRVRLLGTWARILLIDGDLDRAAGVAFEALNTSVDVEDPATRWSVSMTLGAALAQAGRTTEAGQVLDAAAELTPRGSLTRLISRPSRIVDVVAGYGDAAAVLDRVGRSADALSMATRGVEAARRLGVHTWGAVSGAAATAELVRVGRWDEASELVTKALEVPGAAMAEAELRAVRATLRTYRGAMSEAVEDLEAASRLAGHDPPAPLASALNLALAEHAAWRGMGQRGREAVDAGLAVASRSNDSLTNVTLAVIGLRLEADASEIARARRNASEMSVTLDRGGTLLGLAFASAERLGALAIMRTRRDAEVASARAEFARLKGDPDSTAWRSVVELRDELHEPFRAAYARWRLGETLLLHRGDRTEAMALLRRAWEQARSLGARGLADEVGAVARRARIDLEPPTATGDPSDEATTVPTLGLSERELEVLALVAEGRTNRQIGEALFITEKTAGHHVSNIISKLGVANRLEAAAIAHRAGLLPE